MVSAKTRKQIVDEVERGASVAEAAAKAGLAEADLDEALRADPVLRREVERAAAGLKTVVRRKRAKAALEGDLGAAESILSERRPVVDGTWSRPGDSLIDPRHARRVTRGLAREIARGEAEDEDEDEGDDGQA